jgi:3-(3-hydroxy-phenyl)propionate hydroxylase
LAIVESDGLLEDWFESTAAIAALVRPDHYVFGIARQPAELEALSAHARGRIVGR